MRALAFKRKKRNRLGTGTEITEELECTIIEKGVKFNNQ